MIDIFRAMIETEAGKLAGEAGESVQLKHVHSAIANVSSWFHEAREGLVREHGAPMAVQPKSSNSEVVAVQLRSEEDGSMELIPESDRRTPVANDEDEVKTEEHP